MGSYLHQPLQSLERPFQETDVSPFPHYSQPHENHYLPIPQNPVGHSLGRLREFREDLNHFTKQDKFAATAVSGRRSMELWFHNPGSVEQVSSAGWSRRCGEAGGTDTSHLDCYPANSWGLCHLSPITNPLHMGGGCGWLGIFSGSCMYIRLRAFYYITQGLLEITRPPAHKSRLRCQDKMTTKYEIDSACQFRACSSCQALSFGCH